MEEYEIAVDARMISASGIGIYLQNILPAVCKKYKTALLGDKNELKGYNAEVIEYTVPIYSVKELATLPFRIPECKLFWSPHFNVPISAVRAKYHITTIHDVFHLAFYKTLSRKQKIYATLFYNLAAHRSNTVITVSDFSKQEILKHTFGKQNRVNVINNGVYQESFSKSFSEVEAALIVEKYNLPKSYVLFVGNVKPHKNLIGLINALEDIFKKNEGLSLVIVGKRDGFITGDNEVGKLIEASPLLKERIVFTGFAAQEDLPLIYQKARLFAMPSIYEGFGLPPLEAMAANTLTAVSNQASLPEICKDGVLYFNPHEKKDIENTIEKALNLSTAEVNEIKDKAARIAQQYSWEKARQEHINLFDEYIL